MRLVFLHNYFFRKAGLERIWADRLNLLADKYGYEVFFLVKNHGSNSLAFPLSKNIHFIDLELEGYKAYNHKMPRRLWHKFLYFSRDRNKLKSVIDSINPDIIFITSYFDTNLLFGIQLNVPVIIESHEDRSSLIDSFSNKNKYLKILKEHFIRSDFKKMQQKAATVVCLTELDKLLWEKYGNNVVKIPNMSLFIEESETLQDLSTKKKVLAAGRLVPEKGMDLLIKSWEIVAAKHADWELLIYASAGPVIEFQQMIDNMHLEKNVHIMPPAMDMKEVYSNCDFFALSSRHEGFALVLVEALSQGKPCVAFDCPYGPKEIIDNTNGLLVENGNVEAFGSAICRMIEDESFREYCTRNARPSVYKFAPSVVMPMWIDLYKRLMDTGHN